jgi:C4-dicarboxylate transporter DctM subunit
MDISTVQIGMIMIGLVLLLMCLGMPVGVTMILSAFIGLIWIRGIDPANNALGILTWRQGINDILLVIPLFTWMGMLAASGGISDDAFISINKWVGNLPGGMAMACTAACAAFGMVCGNNIATAVTMCTVALPQMRKFKYKDEFSLGTISAAGNLGIMIPPSGSFVIYGYLTETSIGALFIAGILPGILITIMFIIQIYLTCKIKPEMGPVSPRVGWIDRIKGTSGMLSIVVIFVVVMGGIYIGIFTPSEAAAIGCFAVMIVGIIKGKLKLKNFMRSTRQTLMITAMIMLMIIGAMLFGSFLTTSGIPNSLTRFVSDLELNRFIVLGVVLLIYLIAGCLLDIFAILVITLPIFFPIVSALGFDSLQFGVLCVLCIMIGSVSPPFGMVVFAIGGMNKDVPVVTIFKGVIPFCITMLVGLVILVFIPAISTLLPSNMIK